MKDVVPIVGICLGAMLLGTHMTAVYYQRKMQNFARNANGLLQQVGALEFFMKQQEARLMETHQIALRMENIVKGIVETSCDEESCKHMHSILTEFSHLKERNDKILGRMRIKEIS